MDALAVTIDWIQTLAPAGFTAALSWIVASHKRRSEESRKLSRTQDAIANGLKSILRQHVVDAYECYVKREVPMTVERYHELNSQHDAYKALDGNGVVDHLWEAISDIGVHVVPHEDAKGSGQ